MKKSTAHIRVRLDRPLYDQITSEAAVTGKSVGFIINQRLAGTATPPAEPITPQTQALVRLLLAGLSTVERLVGGPWYEPANQRRCMQALQCVLGAAYPGDEANFDKATATATLAAVNLLVRTGGQQ